MIIQYVCSKWCITEIEYNPLMLVPPKYIKCAHCKGDRIAFRIVPRRPK